jgi:hypothetical protein
MLSISVLAGFGLKFILARFKSNAKKIVIAGLFYGLILFEFWNYPPFKVIDLSMVPGVYHWLKEQPKDFVIAEYPLDAATTNELYRFYQTKYAKKRINATIPGSYANKVTKSIKKLSSIETAPVLSWMDVRYVLVHKQDYLNSGLIEDKEELGNIKDNTGLKFLETFGDVDVYEVIAHPKKPGVKDEDTGQN